MGLARFSLVSVSGFDPFAFQFQANSSTRFHLCLLRERTQSLRGLDGLSFGEERYSLMHG